MAAVLHELLKERGDWTTYADLAEDLKRRCARLKIPYHAGLVSYAIDQVEASTHRRLIIRPPDGAGIDTAPPEGAAPPSHAEAVHLLQQLRVALPPSMPRGPSAVRELTPDEILRRQHHAAQRRAFEFVQREILETAQRCDALERAVGEDEA